MCLLVSPYVLAYCAPMCLSISVSTCNGVCNFLFLYLYPVLGKELKIFLEKSNEVKIGTWVVLFLTNWWNFITRVEYWDENGCSSITLPNTSWEGWECLTRKKEENNKDLGFLQGHTKLVTCGKISLSLCVKSTKSVTIRKSVTITKSVTINSE